MTVLAGGLVVVFGLGLLGLAALVVVDPLRAERFLGSFASSARAHYLEQTVRLAAGGALFFFSPSMAHSRFFRILGILLLATSVGLLLMPWRWHHAFGTWAIPLAIRHMRLYALGAFALGAFVLYSALAGLPG